MSCGVISTGQKRKSGCGRPADYVSGVAPGPYSAESLLESLYSANPEAVINGKLSQYHEKCTRLTSQIDLETPTGTLQRSNTDLESRPREIRCGNRLGAVSSQVVFRLAVSDLQSASHSASTRSRTSLTPCQVQQPSDY
jgi:hypothetical protein